MKKPELLAPGGSFHSAYYALQAGADGVYLGLTEFSARKAALNFTFEQLRRIKRLASDRGKKIYVTINTVVRESEIERLAQSLIRLELIAVDGIIVQDLGTLSILKSFFPDVPIHASTQMAVHNSSGIEFLKELGVRRVILPRELTLDRIRILRKRHPDMELEAFIHGALCYSFSGVCLASHALTGRSGNRGDCAQICRSLFGPANGGRRGRSNGHYFSCRDLFLGREVLELAKAGIDAFKIEGRMKSPEYVYSTVRLYREIIDRREALGEEEYLDLVKKTELTFSREKTNGFLRSASGSRLIDTRYPGHRGAFLAKVRSVSGSTLSLTLESDLSVHDGLAYYTDGSGPFIFSVQEIRKSRSKVKFARKGETVSIDVSAPPVGALPVKGQAIYQLSSRFLDLPQPKEASFPLYQVPVDVEISLRRKGAAFTASVKPTGGPSALIRAATAAESFSREVLLETAVKPRPFSEVLHGLFRESGDSLFTLGKLSLENESGKAPHRIFIPPSMVKKLKNEFYRCLDSLFEEAVSERVREVVSGRGESTGPWDGSPRMDAVDLSERRLLAVNGRHPIPFVRVAADGSIPDAASLASRGGFTFVPLPPVILDEEPYLEYLTRLISGRPDTLFAVGLSNVSHIAIAGALDSLDNVRFFIDFPLYVANGSAFRFFSRAVKRLIFQYFWIEGSDDDFALLAERLGRGAPLVRVSPSFAPPLFTSYGCFAKHALNGGACAEGCPRSFSERIRQGRNRFLLVVEDCVTYLFKEQ